MIRSTTKQVIQNNNLLSCENDLIFFHVLLSDGCEGNASEVSMPRSLWLMRHQDMLASDVKLPKDRSRAEEQIQDGRRVRYTRWPVNRSPTEN